MNAANNPPQPDIERFRWLREQRIRSGIDYQRIYARRQRAGDRLLLIFADAGQSNRTRAGITVSKKFGNSVQRHRLKRMLRETFRLEQHQLPGQLDLVLIPGAGAATASLADLRASLRALAKRLDRQLSAASFQKGSHSPAGS